MLLNKRKSNFRLNALFVKSDSTGLLRPIVSNRRVRRMRAIQFSKNRPPPAAGAKKACRKITGRHSKYYLERASQVKNRIFLNLLRFSSTPQLPEPDRNMKKRPYVVKIFLIFSNIPSPPLYRLSVSFLNVLETRIVPDWGDSDEKRQLIDRKWLIKQNGHSEVSPGTAV